MSSSLEECLDQISQSADSISTLYFKPPGIFHNAIVHDENKQYADVITRVIRDGDPQEETSLYKIHQNGLPRRKDGKYGVFEYLTERERSSRRNHATDSKDEIPIIKVPREFYLKQHEQEAKKRRKTTREFFFDDQKVGGVFEVLSKKFESRPDIRNLLQALQNGSVVTDEGSNQNDATRRRRTLFVEDFPADLMLLVLQEVVAEWPVSEYQSQYLNILRRYNDIYAKMETLRSQIQHQEAQLQKREPTSSVSKLIEKEKQEIEQMRRRIAELEERSPSQ
ncbi:LAMI_0E11936g1_1 [Lachancea mirantina]|uniref:DASH complex subunit SPC34 n=1 Tax=Lachancea mirantina TaxID=1230905 RepID=A0A1G4JPS3_9SACH|nr:LAMI_0E11936g1_1 [Lachancea mirantina]